MTLEFPGFLDVHVHFRDPGMTQAETLHSGLAAAARGGFAAVVTMPNTTPACDSVELLRYQAAARLSDVARSPLILPSACITRARRGEATADLEALAAAGAAFFTDDGAFVENDAVMEDAMRRAAALGMAVCQHAMSWHSTGGAPGVIRDCPLARRLDLPVIPVAVETNAIKRDIALCRTTGCRLHIQHISTAEGVNLVREAQREGLPVTAEATPHHLLLSCEELTADDAAFKMAPPLGNNEDRAELRRAVKDGVLMFATDHAPHPEPTKNKGFRSSANGIIGLETAVAITYAVMVEDEGMSVENWAKAWYEAPRRLLRDLPELGRTVVEIGEEYTVKTAEFASLSRNCPYDGMKFDCKARLV